MTRRKREARKEDKRQAAMAPANRALFDAVLRGDIKAAAVHLADGADPSYQSNAVSERNQGEYMSVLYISCMNGNVGLVELLLAHGADPNSQASYWIVGEKLLTPCICSARDLEDKAKSKVIVAVLIKAGANPDAWPYEWFD